jgi:hypothetical protein
MPQWTVWTTELCVSRACVRACVHVRVRVPPWCYLSFQYQVFPLPVLEHLEGLQGADDVHRVHGRLLADLCGAHRLTSVSASGRREDTPDQTGSGFTAPRRSA